MRRPPGRPGHGDELRECRRDFARLCLALGRSRHSAEGDQMAADAPRAAGGAAALGKGHVDLAVSGCCATAPPAAMRSTRRAWCRSPNTAATACARCANEIGITYDERSRGTLQLFRTQSQVDGTGGDIEVLKQFGVPFELLDPAGCIEAEPALARVREKIRGGLRLPGDETGDCKTVHRAARRDLQGARRHLPLRGGDRRALPRSIRRPRSRRVTRRQARR